MTNEFPDGSRVRVYDVGLKRWYKGKVLWVQRIDENDYVDGWEVELRNGNRGSWEHPYIKAD